MIRASRFQCSIKSDFARCEQNKNLALLFGVDSLHQLLKIIPEYFLQAQWLGRETIHLCFSHQCLADGLVK